MDGGVKNGYGCGNRRKSGTKDTFFIKVATSQGLRLQGGTKLRRQLRFLVASFWRLASRRGFLGLQATFRIGTLSIIGRNGRFGTLLQWKGGIAVSQSLLVNYLSPNMITNSDRELRR